jgi:putative hydrolase of the HAD superfamily
LEAHVAGKPYEAIVFDFGGVLITPITDHLTRLADRQGTTMEILLGVLLGPREVSTPDHPWHRAERGEIPTAAFQSLVQPWADAAGLELTGDEYSMIMDGVFDVRDRVLDRIRALRAEGYSIGLLTNSFREFRDHLERRVDFSLFDVVVDSSEVGCRKPEPAIYELTAARTGAAPADILYLDDFLANVDGARAAGWDTIHVTGEAQLLADLDRKLSERPRLGGVGG